jgi:hypothetical protein
MPASASASRRAQHHVDGLLAVGEAVADVRARCVEEARDQLADAVGLLAADPWTALLAHERHHLGVRRLPARHGMGDGRDAHGHSTWMPSRMGCRVA